jgi:hypothetical protein
MVLGYRAAWQARGEVTDTWAPWKTMQTDRLVTTKLSA